MARNLVNKFELAKIHATEIKAANVEQSIKDFVAGFDAAKERMQSDIESIGEDEENG